MNQLLAKPAEETKDKPTKLLKSFVRYELLAELTRNKLEDFRQARNRLSQLQTIYHNMLRICTYGAGRKADHKAFYMVSTYKLRPT
jgi:hypothetical protein